MNSYENRKITIIAIFAVIGLVFTARLLYIQVIEDSYKETAQNQALRYITQYPARGIIYDRNKELLVYNEAAYDLMVVPKQVNPQFDTLTFCELVRIDTAEFRERLDKAREYSRYKASIFEKQIPADQWASISEKLYKYPGFYGQKRTLRRYPKPIASHVLGYVGEANSSTLAKDDYYRKGDYVGINGLEKTYEKSLRGVRGVKVFLVDVHNTIKGSYENGALDSLPISGKPITTTIDRELQAYAEYLMQNKKGSVVAIEPSSGEILTLLSSPGYDPNLLVGRDRSENYKQLVKNDTLDPLFNRAIDAVYRPGSIFKLVQALIGLEHGVIKKETRIYCNRGIINCHGSHTNDNLKEAIQHSCNPYFHQVYKRLIQGGEAPSIFDDSPIGLTTWREYVTSFGLGVKLESDISGINKGFVPDVSFYNRWYGERRWAFSTIYSNSIGEGELGVVPIQMANLASIFANRGFYYTPHLIKQVGTDSKPKEFVTRKYAKIDSSHYQVVIDAMDAVVNQPGGTARRARIDSILVCGKTGTVQNKTTPDHSVFIAFAPKDNPKIAISVYVEEAGFGGTWAAPIASLIMEKYLKGKISNPAKEQRIVDADFIHKEEKKKTL